MQQENGIVSFIASHGNGFKLEGNEQQWYNMKGFNTQVQTGDTIQFMHNNGPLIDGTLTIMTKGNGTYSDSGKAGGYKGREEGGNRPFESKEERAARSSSIIRQSGINQALEFVKDHPTGEVTVASVIEIAKQFVEYTAEPVRAVYRSSAPAPAPAPEPVQPTPPPVPVKAPPVLDDFNDIPF